MLSLLDKIVQVRRERPEILEIAQHVAKNIANISEDVKLLFKDLLTCFKAQTMSDLLLNVSGLESALVLMLIQLYIPTSRSACQAMSDIPLSSFTSLASIRTYLDDLRDYGGSSEMRGHIFVIGNSSAGKTSFIRTLKEFLEHSQRYSPKSILTGDPVYKEFEKTKVLEVVKDLRLTADKSIVTKPVKSESEKLVMIHAQAGQESEVKSELNLSVTDFGGRNVKIFYNGVQSWAAFRSLS